MKTSNSLKYTLIILIICFAIGIYSCRYYQETSEDSVGDNYTSDYHFSKMVDQILDAGRVVYLGLNVSNGPEYKVDTAGPINTIRLYYGDSLRMFYDGVKRKGTALVTWSDDGGGFFNPGNELTLGFESGFLCNGWYLGGTCVITYLDKNEYNQPEYNMVTNGTLHINNNMEWNWNWTNDYTRVKVKGDSTLISTDDVFAVQGIVYGRNRRGRYYDAHIKDSLYFDNSCEWGIVKGRVDIQQVDASERMFVDYGTRDVCDKWYSFRRQSYKATITKNKD